jgi:hypothetical protein
LNQKVPNYLEYLRHQHRRKRAADEIGSNCRAIGYKMHKVNRQHIGKFAHHNLACTDGASTRTNESRKIGERANLKTDLQNIGEDHARETRCRRTA